MAYAGVILLLLIVSVTADEYQFESIGKSSEIFAGKVYQQLFAKPGNILVSPISVQTVLALAQTGANGTTLLQMASTLSLPSDKSTLENAFSALTAQLRDVSGVTLATANKIYVRNDVTLSANFKQAAAHFDAEVDTIGASVDRTPAQEMNSWVESKTNSKIKDIIQDDDITVDTAMVMINALYFKGQWQIAFDRLMTHKADFLLSATDKKQVDMMHATDVFNIGYRQDLDATFLDVPYTNNDFIMTFVLPTQVDGLKNLAANIHRVFEPVQMFEDEVFVNIPRFSLEGEVQFKEILQQLGMSVPFENADFSGLTEAQKEIMISKIIQKTFIDVNEEGTEAAAASSVVFVDRIFSVPRQFNANHPFMFILRQKSSGIILFIGHYSSPK